MKKNLLTVLSLVVGLFFIVGCQGQGENGGGGASPNVPTPISGAVPTPTPSSFGPLTGTFEGRVTGSNGLVVVLIADLDEGSEIVSGRVLTFREAPSIPEYGEVSGSLRNNIVSVNVSFDDGSCVYSGSFTRVTTDRLTGTLSTVNTRTCASSSFSGTLNRVPEGNSFPLAKETLVGLYKGHGMGGSGLFTIHTVLLIENGELVAPTVITENQRTGAVESLRSTRVTIVDRENIEMILAPVPDDGRCRVRVNLHADNVFNMSGTYETFNCPVKDKGTFFLILVETALIP